MKSKKKRTAAPKRKIRRRRIAATHPSRVFTETLQASDLQVNANQTGSGAGQTWTVSMNSIPQIASYKGLYNEFKILKVKFQYVPDFSSYEKNQGLANLGVGGPIDSTPIMAYVVQRDGTAVNPASELAVLTQNGSRIVPFTKPLTITVTKPQPEIYLSTTGGGSAAAEQGMWLDLNGAAAGTNHFGVQTYVTAAGGSTGIPFACGRVYAHVTFALRSTK